MKGKVDPKGTSMDNRPFKPEDRSEFGRWEGDTIVGSRTIPNSDAIFTLVERKTRFQITIKCKDRKALTIYKAIKKIKKKSYVIFNNLCSYSSGSISWSFGIQLESFK